jgi:hypothetical protein
MPAGYLTETNTIGHLAGAILTSLPIGLGGFNPYSFVPSCLLQAGDHLYHDEVTHALCNLAFCGKRG